MYFRDGIIMYFLMIDLRNASFIIFQCNFFRFITLIYSIIKNVWYCTFTYVVCILWQFCHCIKFNFLVNLHFSCLNLPSQAFQFIQIWEKFFAVYDTKLQLSVAYVGDNNMCSKKLLFKTALHKLNSKIPTFISFLHLSSLNMQIS